MFKTALLIYNGNTGQNEIDQTLQSIIPILSKDINNLMLSKTEKEGDAELIAKELGESYEIIISLGGDGTLHEVINGIAELNNPPLIGILPDGTCNDFARSLKIPLNLKEAAENILKTENEEIKDKAGMMIVLNGHYTGSFLVPVESINMQDDLFDIFIVYEAGFSLLIKYLTQKDTFEEEITEDEIKHIQAKDIMIETEKTMQLDTDEEVYQQTPININVVNKKFEFIIG